MYRQQSSTFLHWWTGGILATRWMGETSLRNHVDTLLAWAHLPSLSTCCGCSVVLSHPAPPLSGTGVLWVLTGTHRCVTPPRCAFPEQFLLHNVSERFTILMIDLQDVTGTCREKTQPRDSHDYSEPGGGSAGTQRSAKYSSQGHVLF